MNDSNVLEQFAKKENAFSIKIERDLNTQPHLTQDGKYLNFYLRIFLEIDQSSLNDNIYSFDDISFVKYHLHQSYANPLVISEDSLHNFQISVWAYGYYPIQATIFPKFGITYTIDGFVRFPVYTNDRAIYNLGTAKDEA